jgi:hypothetical protein
MNKFFKRLLLGLIIWVIPFLTSIFVWDIKTNAPIMGLSWFYALMTFTGAIGFSIAICTYFRGLKSGFVRESWITGITWYVELLILDAIFLMGVFKMSFEDYTHLILTYFHVLIISATIGYVKKG